MHLSGAPTDGTKGGASVCPRADGHASIHTTEDPNKNGQHCNECSHDPVETGEKGKTFRLNGHNFCFSVMSSYLMFMVLSQAKWSKNVEKLPRKTAL